MHVFLSFKCNPRSILQFCTECSCFPVKHCRHMHVFLNPSPSQIDIGHIDHRYTISASFSVLDIELKCLFIYYIKYERIREYHYLNSFFNYTVNRLKIY